jgi:ketosteroid isomerase-like protein
MGEAQSSFYDKFWNAFEAKDVDAVAALYTEDCEWVWHSSGKTMGKEAFVGMMPNFFKMPPAQKSRCVYENADICVMHSFNRFPNGDVEGTMMVVKLRNGQVYRVETGSTPIPKDSPNYISE